MQPSFSISTFTVNQELHALFLILKTPELELFYNNDKQVLQLILISFVCTDVSAKRSLTEFRVMK